MMYNVELVRASLIHDGCWGGITSLNDSTIRTIFFAPYYKKSMILGIISVEGSTFDDINEFINNFQQHRTIRKVIEVKKIRNVYTIVFFESIRNMTASIMLNYPILWYYNIIKNGKEDWIILLPKKMGTELKQDLSDVAKIINWNSVYLTKDLALLKPHLTKVESLTLQKAVELGYFESPRRIDLNGLSEMMGVSKQAISTTLRRAIKKLIAKYHREFPL